MILVLDQLLSAPLHCEQNDFSKRQILGLFFVKSTVASLIIPILFFETKTLVFKVTCARVVHAAFGTEFANCDQIRS